jgi:RimJ/RimL family protein N-acetyltransferase
MTELAFTPLQTERLTLRRLVEADFEQYFAYLSDPFVAKYQSWENYPENRARENIEEQATLNPGIPGQAFLFAVVLKGTATLVGHVVLTVQEKDHLQAEIGFTFAREYHGRGLARESAARVLAYAFQDLNLHRVIAITDCENEKSIVLLQRLGMRREGHFIQNIWFKGKWGDEFFYAILSEEWQQSNDNRTTG